MDPREPTIHVAPELDKQGSDYVRGVIWHEIGHALDSQYKFPRDWKLPKNPEKRADQIIRHVFGIVIKYDPYRAYLQCMSVCDGVERPGWL